MIQQSHFWVCIQENQNQGPEEVCSYPCHSSTVHNMQKVEATQMPISRGTDKQKLAHTYKGILFHLKNKEILSHATA